MGNQGTGRQHLSHTVPTIIKVLPQPRWKKFSGNHLVNIDLMYDFLWEKK